MNEEGYKLGGSVVYSIYLKDGDNWILFDTIDDNENSFDSIKKYANILSNSKEKNVCVIEYNAPSEIPKEIKNLSNLTVVYTTEKIQEVYDEIYLKNLLPNTDSVNEMHYTVKEIKDVLTDIFKEEKIKYIDENKKDDDFINITMLIQRNPLIESSNLLLSYSEKKYNNEYVAEELIDIIEENTGMDLNSFTDMIREKGSAHFSKSAHDWVKSQVDKLYPKHIKDKEEAFGIAWKQWKSEHK